VDEVDKRAAASSAAGLDEVVDFSSFARYYALQELARDVDGYAFSDFLAIQGGKLFSIAPWDFDLAFGYHCAPIFFTNGLTGEDNAGTVRGWNVENLRDKTIWVAEDGDPSGSILNFGVNKRQLFLNIWGHASFRAAFSKTWQAARRGPISDDALRGMVQRRSEGIEAAAIHDLGLWRDVQRCAFFQCCNEHDSRDFESAQRHLVQYLISRAHWIDGHHADWELHGPSA